MPAPTDLAASHAQPQRMPGQEQAVELAATGKSLTKLNDSQLQILEELRQTQNRLFANTGDKSSLIFMPQHLKNR